MSRNHDFQSEKICILGPSGCGKSTFTRQLIRVWPADYTFLFDHKDEFRNLLGVFQCRTEREADAALAQTGLVCWKPSGNLKSSLERWMEKVFAACKKLPGRKLIAFDEAGLLLPRHPSKPKDDEAGQPKDFWHPFQAIQETGREFGIDVIAASQRPVHFCQDFRGQFTRFVLFNMPAGWAKPIEEDFGLELSPRLAELGKGQFISIHRDSGETENGETKPE